MTRRLAPSLVRWPGEVIPHYIPMEAEQLNPAVNVQYTNVGINGTVYTVYKVATTPSNPVTLNMVLRQWLEQNMNQQLNMLYIYGHNNINLHYYIHPP